MTDCFVHEMFQGFEKPRSSAADSSGVQVHRVVVDRYCGYWLTSTKRNGVHVLGVEVDRY